jgi:hypothetical protein
MGKREKPQQLQRAGVEGRPPTPLTEISPGRRDAIATGDSLLLIGLAALLTLTYGYELFNVSLNADESYWATLSRDGLFREAVSGGRWVVAATILASPVTVAPALDVAVGLTGMTGGLWWLVRRLGGLSPKSAFLVLAVLVCLPWTALNLAFGLNARAFGVAFVCLAIYGQMLTQESRWRTIGAACAVATAFGAYEAFALGALSVAAMMLVLRPAGKTAFRAGLTLAAGVAASGIVTAVARTLLRVPANPYVDEAAQGWRHLFADPTGVIVTTGREVLSNTGLLGAIFGRSLPWLPLVALIATSMAIKAAWMPNRPAGRTFRILGLGIILAVPFLAQLIATDLPRRAMVYLPIVGVCLAIVGYQGVPHLRRPTRPMLFPAMAGICGLLIFGLASITSVTLQSADLVSARDRAVAFEIDEQIKSLSSAQASADRPVVVMASAGWPSSDAFPARELIGLSAYTSTPWFSAAYLKLQGVAVKAPTRVQYDQGIATLRGMPRYPQPGWVRIEGDLILVRIDDCSSAECAVTGL